MRMEDKRYSEIRKNVMERRKVEGERVKDTYRKIMQYSVGNVHSEPHSTERDLPTV